MVKVQFFKYSQDVFKFFGLWGKVGETQSFKAQFRRYAVVMLLGCFIPIICLSDTISAIKMGDIQLSFTKALYGFAFVVCFHKLAAAAFFNDEIYSCINQLDIMSHKFQDLTDFYVALRTYKRMVKVGTVAMNLSAASFLIAPTVSREFPYNPHLPHLNFTKTPNYELMYAYQAVAIVTVSNVMLAYDSLFCGLMSLCGGVIASIGREAQQIDLNVPDPKNAENSLKDIIEKLIEVSSLIQKISDIFSFTTMTSIVYNCTLMALGLFTVSSLPFSDLNCIAMLFVIIVEAFQLWIYCYFGQVIVNEKQLLQIQLYCTKWYNGSKSFKGMLVLTIFEAQNELYVKAGRILPLSLKTFTEVLKKAYAFYAFLNEAH